MKSWLSLRNKDWKNVKVETKKVNKLFPTVNITELNKNLCMNEISL